MAETDDRRIWEKNVDKVEKVDNRSPEKEKPEKSIQKVIVSKMIIHNKNKIIHSLSGTLTVRKLWILWKTTFQAGNRRFYKHPLPP